MPMFFHIVTAKAAKVDINYFNFTMPLHLIRYSSKSSKKMIGRLWYMHNCIFSSYQHARYKFDDRSQRLVKVAFS